MTRKQRRERRQDAKLAKYMERILLQPSGITIVEVKTKVRKFQFTFEAGPPQVFMAPSCAVFSLDSTKDLYVEKI